MFNLKSLEILATEFSLRLFYSIFESLRIALLIDRLRVGITF
jgi:hypothetical protein